ncbi:PREDICTED: kelch domain-containing protein 7A [Propithecus coquereli]|uniref:kelch domain-containing protein 7A n=1 Tax=Propithecus coquereli TaxID=379532 RepID=UPI00063F8BA2|nr:PREDICTED: kelch domain-containing protein 7A [Propithecus coquereli]
MLPREAGAQDWQLDMQLTGKLVLSAAALLLLTAAYRLYKARPTPAPQGGGNVEAEAGQEAEGSGQPAAQVASPRAPQRGPRRRRRVSKEAGALLGCSWENLGAPCTLTTGATSRDEPQRKDCGEEQGGQCPDSEQVPPCCRGQEAGTAVGRRPNPPRCPHLDSEPKSSPAGLAAAAGGSRVGGEPAPWQDGGPLGPPGPGQLEPPHRPWTAPEEGSSDMNRSWVFTHVTGVSREEAGALQAASDVGLARHQQEAATNTSYTFSSVARVRMEENFIQKVDGAGPRLKGKVYDYYVESISRTVSRGRLALRTALAEAPCLEALPRPLGTGAASRGQAEDTEGGAETAAAPRPLSSPSPQGFGRKDSLLQIAENPELQLQPEGLGFPPSPCPDRGALPGTARSSGEPRVQLVAGTNFFHVPLTPASDPDVRLDLGNCHEALTLAKRQNLEALKEAAYKVMSDNYLQVLRSPDVYGCLSGAERELILQRRLRGRKYLLVADVCPQEDSGCLCCYDDERDVWHLLAQLPPEAVSRGCAICSLFNYLFVVSGCQGPGRRPSNRVFCYNPLTGIWSEVCPLNQARPHCRLVALDGHLYAIGGECLNTVERYDPRLDRWVFAPPLPNDTFAVAHTATACANEIFVTGGTLRYLLLRFSAQEQRWWAGPTGGSKDRTAEMVAVNGFLYRFDLNRSLGISVHRCSASARLWYECATYRTPYPDAFQCAVVDNLIYCVGRQRTLCFLADYVSPRFVPKALRSFPTPQGTLLPAVLTLPTPDLPHTRV